MPVEDIEAVDGDGVHSTKNVRDREKMVGRIEEDTAPGEAWRVANADRQPGNKWS